MALKKTSLSVCTKCSKVVLPHHVCEHCGFYGGKEVIDVMAKLNKKEKKKRQKEEAAEHEAHSKHHGDKAMELSPEELSKK